jgi:site-specific DNA recombinase
MVASSNCENVHVNAVVRAGLYLRVSRDRTGLRLAVQRQEDDCRQVATRLGWSVAGMYVDNDLGASGFATKPRAGYKRLLDDLEAKGWTPSSYGWRIAHIGRSSNWPSL